jgi:hypothetical protein
VFFFGDEGDVRMSFLHVRKKKHSIFETSWIPYERLRRKTSSAFYATCRSFREAFQDQQHAFQVHTNMYAVRNAHRASTIVSQSTDITSPSPKLSVSNRAYLVTHHTHVHSKDRLFEYDDKRPSMNKHFICYDSDGNNISSKKTSKIVFLVNKHGTTLVPRSNIRYLFIPMNKNKFNTSTIPVSLLGVRRGQNRTLQLTAKQLHQPASNQPFISHPPLILGMHEILVRIYRAEDDPSYVGAPLPPLADCQHGPNTMLDFLEFYHLSSRRLFECKLGKLIFNEYLLPFAHFDGVLRNDVLKTLFEGNVDLHPITISCKLCPHLHNVHQVSESQSLHCFTATKLFILYQMGQSVNNHRRQNTFSYNVGPNSGMLMIEAIHTLSRSKQLSNNI